MGVHRGSAVGRRSKLPKAPQLRCEYRPATGQDSRRGRDWDPQVHMGIHGLLYVCNWSRDPGHVTDWRESLLTDPAHVHFMSYEQKSTATGFSIKENLLRHITRG